ncbi:MAG TPA: histidine phosphatase family protein [Candidatus Nanopelagicales bacterium]|nr:histidine phosphatase family protein [Candidatus Nanopelagicales bacterium]
MPTVILVRHGRTAANASGVLAGWTPGVHLDDKGREQAAALGTRMRAVPLAAVVTSPLERTRETAQALLADRDPEPPLHVDDRVGEAKYGDWTNQPLKTLAKEPLWKVVQAHPSAAVFPGRDGEGLADMSARAVTAVRDWNARLSGDGDPTYAVVSHGDVIKAIVADALGLHLDAFQRITIDPCSVTIIRYTDLRPFVVRVNDVGGDLSGLVPPTRSRGRRRKPSSDAAVGGGAGA